MKRNTKSRENNTLFILLCLLTAGFATYQFYKSLTMSLTKLNETPIATITFKHRTAQRRFTDRVVWDRLRQNSPVYNGDLIRTAEGSEATVYFSDGNIMDLNENTLAQLYLNKKTGAAVQVNGGTIKVKTASSGMKITSGKTTLTVAGKSAVTAEKGENDSFSVQVGSGNALVSSGGTQSAVQKGEAVVLAEENAVPRKASFSVINPSQDAKFLSYVKQEMRVPFSFSYSEKTPAESVVVETSSDVTFTDAEKHTFNSIQSVSVVSGAGSTWWRVFLNGSETPAASGKYTVLYAPVPVPVVPAQDDVVTYGTKNPDIRFIWTDNDWATAYQLEVADNGGMKNPVIVQRSPQASSIISTLGEGTWYWRVVPYYAVNGTGLVTPSKITSFRIKKQGAVAAPAVLFPQRNAVVHVTEKAGPVFSWSRNADAVSYQVAFSRNSDMSNPVIFETTSDNFLRIDTKKYAMKEGLWYWQTASVDAAGNTAKSPVQTFKVDNADSVELKLTYPPDGYTVSVNSVQDMRYIWKTDSTGTCIYELSPDKNFSKILAKSAVSSSAVNGRVLAPGTYYWRVSAGGGKAVSSQSFTVEKQLAVPECVMPVSGSHVVLNASKTVDAEWTPVSGAEYYQVKLYKTADTGFPVAQADYVNGTEYRFAMNNLAKGEYVWTVQAFRNESAGKSRASGTAGTYRFITKEITPVRLVSPADGKIYNGVQVRRTPVTVTWETDETPASSTFTLYKNTASGRIVSVQIDNPPEKIQLPNLTEGKYSWTVTAKTQEGYDISAKNRRAFKIESIEKLPAVTAMTPADGFVIGPEYLRKSRQLTVSWTGVPNADRYVFKIIKNKGDDNAKDKVLITQIVSKSALSYTITDLSRIGRGSFTWTVEAQSLAGGEVYQHGKESVSHFTIDLPVLKKSQVLVNGDLYGE